jgi:hypothetical protein
VETSRQAVVCWAMRSVVICCLEGESEFHCVGVEKDLLGEETLS